MDHICAPWRSEYFGKKEQGCVFCNVVNHPEKDTQAGVLFRAKRCFGIMNLYPYTPGHFMVIPYVHTDNIESLDEQTWSEMSAYVREGVKILKRELNAAGVNIGMNLGKAGGAGISEHVHYHLVPRWSGDTNFITSIAEVRVNGVPFTPLYEKLKAAFADVCFNER